jgi:hypothetical protein
MTPTGIRVCYALIAVLVGYGAILAIYIARLWAYRLEPPGDRSPSARGAAVVGSQGDAGDSREALTDGLCGSSSLTPRSPARAAGPFSSPVLAGDRSHSPKPGRGTSVLEVVSGSREGLEDTSEPSACRPSGDRSTVRPFSDPEAA